MKLIGVQDLPKEKVWISLDNGLQTKLILKGHEIAHTFRNLARLTGVTVNQLYNPTARDRPKSIKFFESLLSLLKENNKLKLSLKDIEDKIVKIQVNWKGNPIRNPKIPFEFDSEAGATILSSFYFDGGFDSNFGCCFYSNEDEIMKTNFINVCKEIFGDFDYRVYNSCDINLPKIIGYILLCGFDYATGKRSVNNPGISHIILKNNNKEFIYTFLRQAFSDEGTVSTSEVRLRLSTEVTYLSKELREKIKQNSSNYIEHAPNLLKDLKFLLEKVGIYVNGPRLDKEYNYKDKENNLHIVHSWDINISSKDNLELFRDKIGFVQDRKNNKLNKIISNIKENHFSTKRAFDIVYNKILKLNSEGKIITCNELAKELSRGPHMTNIWLRKLVRLGYLKRVSGKGCRYYPYEYSLSVLKGQN